MIESSFLISLGLSARTYPHYVLVLLFFVWGIALFLEGRKPKNDGRTFGWSGLFLLSQSLYQVLIICMKESRLSESPSLYLFGIIVNTLALLFGVGAVWCAFLSIEKALSKWVGGSIVFYMILLLFWLIPADFMEVASFSSTEELETNQLEKKEAYEIKQYRLSVKDPGPEWKRMDPSLSDPTGTVVLLFVNDENIGISLSCTRIEDSENMTNDLWMNQAFEEIKKNTVSLKVLAKTPSVQCGIEGIRSRFSMDHGYTKVGLESWIGIDGDIGYAVAATGELEKAEKVGQALKNFLSKVQIDDKRGREFAGDENTIAQFVSPLSPDDLYSEQYGINFEGLGKEWNLWPKGKDTYPTCEMAFSTVNKEYLVITPVYLPTKSLPTEALFQSLLELHGLSPHKVIRDKAEKSEIGSVLRYEQTFWSKGDREGQRIYGRVVWTNNMAWVLHAEGMAVSRDVQNFLRKSVKDTSITPSGIGFDFEKISSREKQRQGLLYSGLGQYFEDLGIKDKALEGYRAALSWDLENEVYLLKVLDGCIEKKQYEEALKTMELTGGLYTASARVQATKGYLFEMLEREVEALDRYTYAFNNWLRDDKYFECYLRLLVKNDEKKEAEQKARGYLNYSGSREVRLVLAELLEQAGAFDEAVSLLTIIETESIEYDPEIRMALARVYLRAGKYRDSYRILRELISKGHGTEDVFQLKEEADQYQDWIRKANDTFEYAVSGVGEFPLMIEESGGDPLEVKRFVSEDIPPVRITHLVYPEDMGISTATAPYRIPLWLKAVVHRPDVSYRETTRINYEILSRDGFKVLNPLHIQYFPDEEDLSIGVVHFYNNEKQDLGELDRRKITYQAMTDTESGLRKIDVLIPLPTLEENTFIELIYTIERKEKPKSLPLVMVDPVRSVPIGRVALLVDSASLPVSFKSPLNYEAESKVGIHRYIIKNVLPPYKEAFQGPTDDNLPLMIAADASTNWDLISEKYIKVNQAYLEGDPRLYDIAADLTKGSYSIRSKVEKLARAVREGIAYNLEPFGKYNQTPRDAVEVMQSKVGSALDHSLLFVRLADCAGINAQLVFAHTDHDPIKGIKSFDQFNTVIVRVEEGRNVRYLDLTQKDRSVNLAVPLGYAGKEVYILSLDRSRFITLPSYSEEENSLKCSRVVIYGEDGGLSVEEQWSALGYSKDSMEKQLIQKGVGSDDAELLRFLKKQIPAITHLKSISQNGVGKPDDPLEVHFLYDVQDVVNRHLDRWIGSPSGSLEGVFLKVEKFPNRKLPFEIELPIHFAATVECHFPKGMILSGGDLIPLTRKTPYVDWSVSYENKGTYLEIEFDFQRHAGIFSAKEYTTYRQVVEEALRALQPNVVIVKE